MTTSGASKRDGRRPVRRGGSLSTGVARAFWFPGGRRVAALRERAAAARVHDVAVGSW